MKIEEYIKSGIIESYVLGLATAEEIAEVEELSIKHIEVKKAIEEFEASLINYSVENSVQPPAFIKSNLENILKNIFAAQDNFQQNKYQPVLPAETKAPVYSINAWRYVAAASIVLLIVSTALNFYFYNSVKNSNNRYEALVNERNTLQANNAGYKSQLQNMQQSMQLMEDSNMISVKMKAMPGKENNFATIYWNKKTKEVYLNANNMQTAPTGKQFQLWAIVDGKPVDAGMVSDCTALCKMKTIDHAQAFAITLEKQGGSPTPTMSALYVMGKV